MLKISSSNKFDIFFYRKKYFLLTNLFCLFVLGAIAKEKSSTLKERANEWMKNQPVKFLENKGQMTDDKNNPIPFVLFKASVPGTDLYITEKGITYLFFKSAEEEEKEGEGSGSKRIKRDAGKLKYSRADMNIYGSVIKRENVIAESPSVTDFNFFAPHCPNGIYGVKEYEKVTIKNIYPGIDWILYNSDATGFKYDFIVHAGADPKQIRLVYEWAHLDKKRNGDLEAYTPVGSITDHKPVSFLEGSNQPVETAFEIENKNEVSFFINRYDNSQTLVIDPQLTWATYYGGNDDEGALDVTVDLNGNVYITGYLLRSTSFPTQDPGSGAYYQGVNSNPNSNCAIVKFNNVGVRLWATYYSGNLGEQGLALTTDNAGNLFVLGSTSSSVFPLQAMAGAFNQAAYGGGGDIFLLKFNPTGIRTWATYYGGSGKDGESIHEEGIVVDNAGNVYVTGTTQSIDFPLLNPGGGAYFQGAYGGASGGFGTMGDAFVLKFNSGVHSLQWSTYYGGLGEDAGSGIDVDAFNNVYVTGHTLSNNFPIKNLVGAYNQSVFGGAGGPGLYGDAFILKFDGATSASLWATYYGGNGDDLGEDIVVNITGDIFVAGWTATGGAANNFPVYNPGGGAYYEGTFSGTQMGIILKFDAISHACGWATYYGSTSGFKAVDIAADKCGNIYVTGLAGTSLPVLDPGGCSNYFSGTLSGLTDIAVIEFNSNCVRLWATYFGGNARDWSNAIAVSNTMDIYAVGEYQSTTGIPLTNPGSGAYFQTTDAGGTGPDDWAIVKFSPVPHSITQSQVNPASCSCNGTATVNITCGLPPYTYNWSNGQTSTTNSTSNTTAGLCPGLYKATITDGACIQIPDVATFNIAGGTGSVFLSGVQTDVTCNGSCTGSATVSAGGGNPPYMYSWSNGNTTAVNNALCSGTYSVAVEDVGGCTSVLSVNITQPPQIVSWYSTQWFCSSNSASATVSVANASTPLNYNWSNSQTTKTASGLTAGNYTVTVTDSKGCTISQTANIIQPPALNATVSGTNISCNVNGSASVSVSSGVSPYTYKWSDGQSSATISLIPAGGYTVTVTDGNGCNITKTVNISSTSPASAAFTHPPLGCIGTTTNFVHTGTAPGSGVTFNWIILPVNVSGQTADFSYNFLTAGTYTVQHTVTIAGCSNTVNSSIAVGNCNAPTVTATGNTVCQGTCATVTTSGSGGTGSYTYSWSTGATTQNINPCPASTTTYTVKITDAGGNTATSTAQVLVNSAVTALTNPTNITCSGNSNGSILVSPGGGTSPYVYVWSNGQTSQTATNLPAGNFIVTVVDAKGCTATSNANIISPPALSGQFTKGTSSCPGCGCKQWIMVNAAGGTSPYNYSWPDGYNNRYKNHLCPGNYTINIKDKNGCTINVSLNAP